MNTKNRSDQLLPADDQVAEEVNTDQQSPATRRIGQLPQQPVGGQSVAEAVAEAAGASDEAGDVTDAKTGELAGSDAGRVARGR